MFSISTFNIEINLKTKLPVTMDYLKPKITKLSDHQNKIKIKTDNMVNYYTRNKNTKILKPLSW